MTTPSRVVVAAIVRYCPNGEKGALPGLAMLELVDEKTTGRTLEIPFTPYSPHRPPSPHPEKTPKPLVATPGTAKNLIRYTTTALDDHVDAISGFIQGATLRALEIQEIIEVLDDAFSRMDKAHQTASLVAGIDNLDMLSHALTATPGTHRNPRDLSWSCQALGLGGLTSGADNHRPTVLDWARKTQMFFEALTQLDFDVNEPLGDRAFPPLLNAIYYGNASLAQRLFDKGADPGATAVYHGQTFNLWHCLLALPKPNFAGSPTTEPKKAFLDSLMKEGLTGSSLAFVLDGGLPDIHALSTSLERDWNFCESGFCQSLLAWTGRQAALMLDARTPKNRSGLSGDLRRL